MEKLKAMLLQRDGGADAHCRVDSSSHDVRQAEQEAAQAQENLKVMNGNVCVVLEGRNTGVTGVIAQIQSGGSDS